MRLARLSFIALSFIASMMGLLVSPACSQTLLKKVESQLRSAPATTPNPGEAETDAAPELGYLGVAYEDTTPQGQGVVVQVVKPGAPSELGGMRVGDVITSINGKAIKSINDLDTVLDAAAVGARLDMNVARDGKNQLLTVTLGRRPVQPAAGEAPAGAGAAPALGNPAGAAPPVSPLTVGPPTGISSFGIQGASDADVLPPPGDGRTPAAGDRPAAGDAPAAGAPAAEPSFGPRRQAIEADPLSRPPPSDLPAPPAAENPLPRDASLPPDTGAPAAGGSRGSLGITVLPLTEEARATYGVPVRRGALITAVRADSPADRAGMPIGGVVVSIDGRKVDTADDLVNAIRDARAGQDVELGYYQGNQFARKVVRLAPAGTVAVAPRAADSVPGLGLGLRGGGDRPLLNRVERIVDNLATPRPNSTVIDPSVIAAMRDEVTRLTQVVEELQARVDQLEAAANPGAAVPGAARPGAAPPAETAPGAFGTRTVPAAPLLTPPN